MEPRPVIAKVVSVVQQRSAQWYAGTDRNAYIHRAWMRRGLPAHAFDGRPHIAIANTASDLTPCNAHLNEVAESVKQGVWEAGGIPLNLPVVSLGETLVRPTAMLWRNMAAMATEEMLRANPIDGVVLLGGCDKTIPALLMAAASVDLPAVVVPGGPMLTGTFRGQALGCGTDVWRLSEEVRAGTLSEAEFLAVRVVDDPQPRPLQHHGHRLDDGAASPRRSGWCCPAWPARPLPTAGCSRAPTTTGRLAVEMVAAQRTPSSLLTRGSFLNAIVALAAIGGSTNAVVHLLAIAGRLGIELTQDDFDRTGSQVPLLVDLQPAGRFLMEDFFRAGGLLAVLREVQDLLDPAALTVTGRPLVEHLADAEIWDARSSARAPSRCSRTPGIAVLRRQPGPGRRGDQARGGVRPPAAAPRTGGGLRLDRGHARSHRRPGPGRRRRLGAGPARLRPEGLSGHARGGEHAAAGQAPAPGRARHGSHL